MKKQLTIILFVLALIFTLGIGSAFAQGSVAPGTWASSINIQNIGAGAADIVITFYNAAGTSFTYTHPSTVPAGGSLSLYVPQAMSALLAAGQYAAVVSSNQEILVVANSSSTTPYTAGAYNGISSAETATKLYFPGLYNNYYTFHSEVVIQNTTDTAANVKLTFYNANGSYELLSTINANTSKAFPLASVATTPALTSGSGAGGLYSLIVESTSGQPLAGVANNWSSRVAGMFSNYNGYTQGSTIAYAPALYKSYYGFVSSLTVQNIHDTETAVGVVTYSNGSTSPFNLAPGKSIEFYQPSNGLLPSGNALGVFSAKVATTTGSIVALVNIEGQTRGSLASYNGAPTGAISVKAPVVMHKFYDWFTAVTVQNVGTQATDVKITYAGGQTQTFNDVPANGTVNIIQLASSGTTLPAGQSVSAVIESLDGQPLVAVVQEDNTVRLAQNAGDYLLAYTGVP